MTPVTANEGTVVESRIMRDGGGYILHQSFTDGAGNVYKTVYATPARESANIMTRSSSIVNFARSVETWQWFYNGEIQFRASYTTGSNPGSGLMPHSRVRQGAIDYRRNGNSVIGGRVYTTIAFGLTDDRIHRRTASTTDHILPGDRFTTMFYRWWWYFQ